MNQPGRLIRAAVLASACFGVMLSGATWGIVLLPDNAREVSQTTPQEVIQHYNAGLAALAKGDLGVAESSFRQANQLAPAFVPALLGLAHVSYQAKRSKEAEWWLSKAEQAAPRAADVHASWGRYYFGERMFDKAEASFKRAIEYDPQAFAPRIDLADLYMTAVNKPQDALKAYRAAIDLRPEHGGAHYGAGMALVALGKTDDSIAELEKAARLAPRNPLPLQALGRIHLSRKNADQAVAMFTRAIAAQPDFTVVRLDRGDAYAMKGDVSLAIADYEAVAKSAPKYPLPYLKLGMLHQAQRQWPDAEKAYLRAIEADPNNAVAYNNLAWMAAERKTRLDDALTWARKAVDLGPKVAAFQDTLGWVHRSRGELNDAATALQKAVTAEPQQPGYLYHLGVIHAEQGRQREALANFRKALESNQKFAEADDARRRVEALSKR